MVPEYSPLEPITQTDQDRTLGLTITFGRAVGSVIIHGVQYIIDAQLHIQAGQGMIVDRTIQYKIGVNIEAVRCGYISGIAASP